MNDPCPSCDGDEYDNASGECSECGYVDDVELLDETTPIDPEAFAKLRATPFKSDKIASISNPEGSNWIADWFKKNK